MRKLAIAAAHVALVLGVFACGGNSTTLSPSRNTPGSSSGGGTPVNLPVVQGDALPDLPDTIAPQPDDLDRALSEAAARAPQPAAKQASAIVYTLPTQAVAATSPVGGGTAHDYMPKVGLVWAEAQSTALDSEYHITGTVNTVSLQPDGFSYASIGVVNWFDYDYAVNVQAKSSYMFNQSLYIHIRQVSTDAPGTVRVRLNDSNGRWLAEFANVPVPFTFDLRMVPDNPIISNPAVAPFTSHRCGLADLTINGFPLPGALEYGNDNWGWRTAAGPERYDAGAGGTTIFGQAYASGNAVTAALNFDAQFLAGTIATPEPGDSYCRSHDRSRRSASSVQGPQGPAPGVLWSAATGQSVWSSSPVVDAGGNVYFSDSGGFVNAYQSNGIVKPGWPVATGLSAGWGAYSSVALGVDGTVYATFGDSGSNMFVFALNPDGTLKWPAVLGGGQVLSSLVEVGDYLYAAPSALQLYILDKNTGALVNTVALPAQTNLNGAAFSADASRFYLNTAQEVSAFSAVGLPLWTFSLPGGAVCVDSMPVVAPDGTVFVTSYSNILYAIQDNGLSASLNTAFGGTGMVPGANGFNSPAIFDLGAGSYRVTLQGPSGQNLTTFDQAGNVLWANPGVQNSINAPVIGADGKVYTADSSGSVTCNDGATGALVWSLPLGQPINSTPVIGNDGTLFVVSVPGTIFAISDSVAAPVQIDARNLTDASFTLYNAANAALTGTLDSDTVFDATPLGLAAGNQFYVQFDIDPLASPNDLLVHPERPDGAAGGLVTVTAAGLTIPASLTPYFTNPPGTRDLVLVSNAYNRIGNDVSSLSDALYTFFDTQTSTGFSAALDTDASPGKNAVLAANCEYQLHFSNDAYPASGSNSAFLGGPEAIYPQFFNAGRFVVGFATLTETGSLAGANDDNCDLYDQAGLLNTLQTDAYCRFETQAGPGLVAQYGFRDATTGSWIVVPSFPFGREPLAQPYDTFAFARGTTFEASDGALFATAVTVNPGKQLGPVAYPGVLTVPLGASALAFRPLPVRIYDDVAQADPGQAGADVTGSGPWNVPLNFLVQYGAGPWTVELDSDFGAAWDDGVPGRVQTLPGSPFAATGLMTANASIPALQGAGSYAFAIRVTDNAGTQYTYTWPNLVVLGAAPAVGRGDWYMAGGNRKGNGQSAYNGPLSANPIGGWLAGVFDSMQDSGPVLDSLDNAYFSVGIVGAARFYGMRATPPGLVAGWPYDEPTSTGAGRATSCVGPDGTIYFPVGNGGALTLQGVVAMNQDGTLRWSFDAPVAGSLVMSDLACENGHVYFVATHDTFDIHNLYTLNAATGAFENVVDVGPATPGLNKFSRGGFAVNDLGNVYYSGYDALWCLSPGGSVLYSTTYAEQPTGVYYGNPVIAPDGTVFVADAGGVRSYMDTGFGFLPNFTWAGGYLGDGSLAARTPAIRDLGAGQYDLYFAATVAGFGCVRRYDSAGNLDLTSALYPNAASTQPALGADGTVYWGANGSIFAMDGVTLGTVWSQPTTSTIVGLALTSENGLFATEQQSALVRIHD